MRSGRRSRVFLLSSKPLAFVLFCFHHLFLVWRSFERLLNDRQSSGSEIDLLLSGHHHLACISTPRLSLMLQKERWNGTYVTAASTHVVNCALSFSCSYMKSRPIFDRFRAEFFISIRSRSRIVFQNEKTAVQLQAYIVNVPMCCIKREEVQGVRIVLPYTAHTLHL